MRLSSLHIYPLKAARGIALGESALEPRGLVGDRRWVAADPDGVHLTQRECAALARLVARPVPVGIHLSADGAGEIVVRPDPAGARRRIRVWKDAVDALDAGEAAADWLSGALGRPARLFHMDDAARRATSGRWGPQGPVSFADAYPLLVTSTASLDALNEAIARGGGAPVGMERFRPNIVIDGAGPWAEDRWRALRIGAAVIELVKPCARCVVTTVDQASGARTGREPLKTLARIRRSAHPDLPGALFGWNAILREGRALAAGEAVEVLEAREEGWPLAGVD
ncbi:MAG: MOSC domain-containing protein [Amphiplicatus sp.]